MISVHQRKILVAAIGAAVATAIGGAPSIAQIPPPISVGDASAIFRQAHEICTRDDGKLWGRSLCGPIMLVDPRGRKIVANRRDAGGTLTKSGGYFAGVLPASENIANTATPWSGTFWTQIVWPLPDDTKSRGVLIAHEMFHRIAPKLDLPLLHPAGDNHHLDTLDGRYLLQLEWRALAAALKAKDAAARKQAIEDALIFRAERYRIFPSAAADEDALEINEGLAEYTGIRLGLPSADRVGAALGEFVTHSKDQTFVRSFAYATGPAYGLLLDRYAPSWRKRLASQPRLDLLLAHAADVRLPADLNQVAEDRALAYGGPELHAAEAKRDAVREQMLASYRKRFVQGPTVVAPLVHMNIQFDPRNLQPLDELGTVYPTARVTDDWGVLDAKNGVLLSPKWDRVTLSGPATTSGNVLSGDGWTIELKPGWTASAGPRPGDVVIKGPGA